ncbi:YlmC/YmxH family sporulation protein [Barrientosiimonas marina]|uniref:YlmC/YmxH family sporulation protein n=1 Tax=Lentibacillus kimchii TaxID=1542911 RepID=A0ABW2UPJ8_9BACI
MRYKDMSSKEIVDINQGSRLGVLGQTDLEIDESSGQIESFVLPNYKWFGLKKEGSETKISWTSIRKIGEDMIMIEAGDDLP